MSLNEESDKIDESFSDNLNDDIKNSKSFNNESFEEKSKETETKIYNTLTKESINILNVKELQLLEESYVGKDIKKMLIYHKDLYDTIKIVNSKLTDIIKEKSNNYLLSQNKPNNFNDKPVEDQIKIYNKEIELNSKYIKNYENELKNIDIIHDKYDSSYNLKIMNEIENYKQLIKSTEIEIIGIKSISNSNKITIKRENFNRDISHCLKKIEYEIKQGTKIKIDIKNLNIRLKKQIEYLKTLKAEKTDKKTLLVNLGLDFDKNLVLKYFSLKSKVDKLTENQKILRKYYNFKHKKQASEFKYIKDSNWALKGKIIKDDTVINDLNKKISSFNFKLNTVRQKSYSLKKNISLKSKNFTIKNYNLRI